MLKSSFQRYMAFIDVSYNWNEISDRLLTLTVSNPMRATIIDFVMWDVWFRCSFFVYSKKNLLLNFHLVLNRLTASIDSVSERFVDFCVSRKVFYIISSLSFFNREMRLFLCLLRLASHLPIVKFQFSFIEKFSSSFLKILQCLLSDMLSND